VLVLRQPLREAPEKHLEALFEEFDAMRELARAHGHLHLQDKAILVAGGHDHVAVLVLDAEMDDVWPRGVPLWVHARHTKADGLARVASDARRSSEVSLLGERQDLPLDTPPTNDGRNLAH
jgi:hypothetical protein